jgi:hypothetical protein
VRVEFSLACDVTVDSFVFVQSEMLGVGADETLVEDAAGEPIELFVFNRLQHAAADFGGTGDVVERDALLLALSAEFVAELAQPRTPARRSGLPARANKS